LIWSSQNTKSCSSPDFSTGTAPAGQIDVFPPATKTYEITCLGAVSGSETKYATVTVKLSAIPGNPECSDGIDNADTEDNLKDDKDPGCINAGVYDPSDNSEINKRRPLFKEL
jgi:hypothetical protein